MESIPLPIQSAGSQAPKPIDIRVLDRVEATAFISGAGNNLRKKIK